MNDNEPSDRWQQMSRICADALAREAAERAAFLQEACAGDDALRRDVESLLANESQAADFETLVGEAGIGPMALRSLSLIAEIIYNAPASHRDPAAYSFAHGGKDGHPYFVNREVYDANLERLREAIGRAKLGATDKIASLQALAKFTARLR